MAHKTHPKIFRIGTILGWNSHWFSGRKTYATVLKEDLKIRNALKKRLVGAAVDRIEIERPAREDLHVTIHTAKPGVVISRGGTGIEEIVKMLRETVLERHANVRLSVVEVKRPALSAAIVVEQVIADLERRLPFRRIMKTTLQKMREAGAIGGKVIVSGRLNGAEIARTERLEFGKLPLGTLRADIDYTRGHAWTTYGVIGVKIWINRGEIFNEKPAVTANQTLNPKP